jgi:hypothetical protein
VLVDTASEAFLRGAESARAAMSRGPDDTGNDTVTIAESALPMGKVVHECLTGLGACR